jgi:hypothetical protein
VEKTTLLSQCVSHGASRGLGAITHFAVKLANFSANGDHLGTGAHLAKVFSVSLVQEEALWMSN